MCRESMNALFRLGALLVFLASAAIPCLAMREISLVSTNEAAAMGVVIRATPAGPAAAWLELEFKTEGRLKDYSPERRASRVELEVRDGDALRVGYVALQEQHPQPGQVRVRFLADRNYLSQIVLTIVVGDGLLPGGAFELRVKDFVDPARLR